METDYRSECCDAEVKTEGIPDFIGSDDVCTVNFTCLKCGKSCSVKNWEEGLEMKKDDECSFCWELEHKRSSIKGHPYTILFETKHFVVKFSLFPVTPRHLLIIPKGHFAKATNMTFNELQDFQECRQEVENWYREQGITAWNSGDNYGKFAGQSIDHFHYHYFDRKKGDVKDFRGGIRNFMPPLEELGEYKDET